MTDYDETCIFCKIATGLIPSELLFETKNVVAFNDISPTAPVHVLIVTKAHVTSVHDLGSGHAETWLEILEVAQAVASNTDVAESGYRLVTNSGPDSGQEVPHLHVHLVGGRKLKSIG